MFSIMDLRLLDVRDWNIRSKESAVATGGISEVTDMGRWREKKDDNFT